MTHRPPIVWIVIIGLVCAVIAGRFLFHALGYATAYSAYEAVQLAGKYVEEGRDARDCFKIRTFIPTYPPLGSFQADCIHEYAKLTLDPSVCELLMPSSYGLSCVGAAMTVRDLCSMGQTDVAWGGGTTSYADCRYDDPHRELRANQCCLIARVAFVRSENNCSPLEPYPELHDECLDSLAFKNGDPDVCDPITQENLKVACIVKARAMHADPSICQGCKERVDDLDSFR